MSLPYTETRKEQRKDGKEVFITENYVRDDLTHIICGEKIYSIYQGPDLYCVTDWYNDTEYFFESWDDAYDAVTVEILKGPVLAMRALKIF